MDGDLAVEVQMLAGLPSSLQLPKTNGNGGHGVLMNEGAKCAHFKENRCHEKDRNRLCCACRNSRELRRGARAEACTQIRAGDDRTGSDEIGRASCRERV